VLDVLFLDLNEYQLRQIEECHTIHMDVQVDNGVVSHRGSIFSAVDNKISGSLKL